MPDIQKLPRTVGIVADYKYPNKIWIFNLVDQMKSKSIIVTASDTIEFYLSKIMQSQPDKYLKVIDVDEWEVEALGRKKAENLRDWVFLQYIKYNKGCLFVFPRQYDTKRYGKRFSERIRDLLIMAHTLNIPVEVIVGEE